MGKGWQNEKRFYRKLKKRGIKPKRKKKK